MKITKLLFISLLISHFVACQPEETKDTANKQEKTHSAQGATAVAGGDDQDKKNKPKKDRKDKDTHKKSDEKKTPPKSTRPPEAYKKINLTQTKDMLAKATGSILLDARNAKDFKEGHMDKAENLDYRDKKGFSKKLQNLDKNKTYIIYGYKAKRAQRAAKEMAKAGFKNLYIVDATADELLGKPVNKKK